MFIFNLFKVCISRLVSGAKSGPQSLDTLSKIAFIYLFILIICSATSFPEIIEGGTPGPGTVN